MYDGRFANNGWLQELPKPITKLTWDNAAIMSPATAHRFGVATEDMVELTYEGRRCALRCGPPGHVNGAVTLHLGLVERARAGPARRGFGFNPYGLPEALWHDTGLEAKKTSGSYLFANTQNQQALDTRRHIIHTPTDIEKSRVGSRRGRKVPPKTDALSRVEVQGRTPGEWRST